MNKIGVKEVGVVVALLINFGGLVWGAARLSSSVDNLKETVVALSIAMNNATTTLNSQTAKIAVLEYRVQSLEDKNGGSGRRQ